MKDRVYQTIIIGAGISGLACARKLHENGKEFLVISKDIGGRILTSKDEKVNYGCYAITENHYYTKYLVKKGRRHIISRMRFHNGSGNYGLYNKRLLTYLPQWIRFLFLVRKFRKNYDAFHKKCETISQAQAIKSNPFLYKLYNQTAKELAQEYRMKNILEDYWSFIIRAFTFSTISEIRAFTFLHLAALVMTPMYEFTYPREEMTKGFGKKIITDSVIQIAKKKKQYLIKTTNKNFYAKNIVVATPPQISAKLLHLREINKPSNTHMFHVSGRLHDFLEGSDIKLLADTKGIFAICSQVDGSHLLLSKTRQPKFKKYFSRHRIINYKCWKSALHPAGHFLWECEQDENLYLIGDHNECCLEDAYVTGIYAANQIVNSER